jgi:hypothetical protein
MKGKHDGSPRLEIHDLKRKRTVVGYELLLDGEVVRW